MSDASSTSKTTSTSSATRKTHTIQVGPKEDPHAYVPHTLEADVGDLVVFEFYPRNHSVVQADWKAPCMPADGDYFFSGIKNEFEEVNGQVVGQLPTWNMTVEKSEPTFFYCTAIDSCIVNGMVGVINPNSTMTWDSQYAATRNASYMLVPGQSMPAEGESTSNSGTGTTPHTTSTSDGSTPGSSSSHSLGAGAIAGIVLGSVSFLIIMGALLFLLGRNHVYKKWVSSSEPGGSSNALRTAKWALSTSSAKSESEGRGSGGGGGRDNSMVGFGGSPVGEPLVPGPIPGYRLGGAMTGTGTGFTSMEYGSAATLPPLGIYSTHEGGHGLGGLGVSSPLSASQLQAHRQSQMQGTQGQHAQQPYWIWDQSIQPHHLIGKKGGPSELEGESYR
ncbi:uncharacterized protein BJX67DRAFT_381369 [Aspergillus lucknowensis]|uniref:Extracellular serine-rich protein n=1 Tax=Aspergillus lucknowensis TaxID=176173 RepID=A0ABR4LRM5_9EURO